MLPSIIEATNKIERVILSCDSLTQCDSAQRMIDNLRHTFARDYEIDTVDGIAIALIELLDIQKQTVKNKLNKKIDQ